MASTKTIHEALGEEIEETNEAKEKAGRAGGNIDFTCARHARVQSSVEMAF